MKKCRLGYLTLCPSAWYVSVVHVRSSFLRWTWFGVVFQEMLGVGKDPAALKAVKQQLRALEHSVLTDESENRSITRVILMSSGMMCSFHKIK